jgi:U6 snRNA-associated Sm-like protein LSm8
VTGDGRIITGIFVGHDQVQNVILNDAAEQVFSEDAPVETVELGLYVIRGDNVVVIGEFDAAKWNDLTAPPLAPIRMQQNT